MVCIALCCGGCAYAQIDAELETRLEQAEAAQEQRQPPLQVQSSIVLQSPTATLPNGDGDISTIGDAQGVHNTPAKLGRQY